MQKPAVFFSKSEKEKKVLRMANGVTSSVHIKNESVSNSENPDLFGLPDTFNITNLRMYSGYPEAIHQWFRQHTAIPASYELFAQVLKIYDDPSPTERLILTRGPRGPVMKVIYFTNDNIDVIDLAIGTWLRCVGIRLNDAFRAYSIRDATPNELTVVQRLTHLCNLEEELDHIADN